MSISKIGILDKSRTSRGRYPVNGARSVVGEDGRRYIEYRFADGWDNPRPVALEDLAGCLSAGYDLDGDEICARIVQFASKTGPLFGAASNEAMADWQLAIDVAQEALRMQQQVNGTRDWLASSERMVKTTVLDNDDEELFTCFNYLLCIGSGKPGRYSAAIPAAPWAKVFGDVRGSDYLFAVRSLEGGIEAFDICLVSCRHSLSTALLAQMLCFFNDQPLSRAELLEIGVGQLEGADIDEVERLAAELGADEAIRFRDSPIGKADAPHVQRIVQAIAALHLQRVTVDLFKSDGTSDSLAFDTFLSSLWYDFAMQLGAVKVGYCQECGAGFSLTGHRGLPKQYCSDECRTKAKNRREQRKRDRIREMYMSGRSIEEIAAELFAGKHARAAKDGIVAELAKWPKLKQTIRAECAKPGDHPFSRRCCDDGIISERDLELLERRAARLARK